MNQPQRVALFVALALAAGVLFVHFPFRGYVYERDVVVKYATAPCPPQMTTQEVQSISNADLAKVSEQGRLCTNQIEARTLPPWEWTTITPIVPWFGSLMNTMAALLLLCAVGGLACWIFRPPKVSA